MSVESTNNILIGSVVHSINKEWVHGSTNSEPIILLNLLVQAFFYSLDQYNAIVNSALTPGEEPDEAKKYKAKLKNINDKILELKNKCPEICNYKDRVVVTRNWNTPPTIEDNTIVLPISDSFQDLNYNNVIYNYNDAENDLVSQLCITNVENTSELSINNSTAIVNNIYPPNVDFSIKYKGTQGNTFISFTDNGGEECNIISINQNELNNVDGYVSTLDENGNAIFQYLNNNTEDIPNDTILYAHIDTSSMKAVDQDLLKTILLDWWDGFRTDNPDFQGSFLISTVPNSDIPGSVYAPGRGANSYLSITGGSSLWTPVNIQEDWLKTPTQALLRQAYKEGLNNMTESQFLSYIEGKSLVVLSFIDEANTNYHGSSTAQGFISNDIIQPTPYYITDYSGYLFKVRPKLGFFKGICYPLVRTSGVVSSFLLHSLAAIEATTLTPSEIDTLVGPDVVDAFGPTLMDSYFYTHLGTSNPYSFLNGLKNSGWEANFTKLTSNITTEPTEAFTSGEFANELNDILTDTGSVQISILEEETIPSINLGESVSSNFNVKVRDNNPIQPLWSNEANIQVIFEANCEETPDCTADFPTVRFAHDSQYHFEPQNITLESNVDKFKITDVIIPSGNLMWHNLPITQSILPVTIPLNDVHNVVYIPDTTVQEQQDITIIFKLSYEDSYSFSDECSFIITKEANTNIPPTIESPDVYLEIKCGSDDSGSATLLTTISYVGEGGYNYYWTKVLGPTGSMNEMVNPLEKDLELENLIEGTYIFRITVITEEDFFIVTKDVTITVGCYT